MFIEIKAVLTVVSFVFIGIVISQIVYYDLLLTFLLFMGMGLYFFGDMLIGYVITRNDLKPQMDPTPRRMETCLFISLTKRLYVFDTVKGPEGQRKFRFNGQDASVINHGDYQIRLPNGNSAFLAHESCEENLNLAEVKYAEITSKEFGTDDLKEIHAIAKAEVKNV